MIELCSDCQQHGRAECKSCKGKEIADFLQNRKAQEMASIAEFLGPEATEDEVEREWNYYYGYE